jgi:hypothetical protein
MPDLPLTAQLGTFLPQRIPNTCAFSSRHTHLTQQHDHFNLLIDREACAAAAATAGCTCPLIAHLLAFALPALQCAVGCLDRPFNLSIHTKSQASMCLERVLAKRTDRACLEDQTEQYMLPLESSKQKSQHNHMHSESLTMWLALPYRLVCLCLCLLFRALGPLTRSPLFAHENAAGVDDALPVAFPCSKCAIVIPTAASTNERKKKKKKKELLLIGVPTKIWQNR